MQKSRNLLLFGHLVPKFKYSTRLRLSKSGASRPVLYYASFPFFKAFRFPLTLPGDWTEHELHGDSVTQMRLSFDDKRLVTTGRDGSLCIWKVGIPMHEGPFSNSSVSQTTLMDICVN